MNQFTMSQMQKELNNPYSPYYLYEPSNTEFVRNYMNGTGGVYYGSLPNRTVYYGQPKQDKFELLANTNKRRKNEAWFITLATAAAGFFALRAGRKIPIVNQIPKLVTPVFKGIGSAITFVGRGIWKLIK